MANTGTPLEDTEAWMAEFMPDGIPKQLASMIEHGLGPEDMINE